MVHSVHYALTHYCGYVIYCQDCQEGFVFALLCLSVMKITKKINDQFSQNFGKGLSTSLDWM